MKRLILALMVLMMVPFVNAAISDNLWFVLSMNDTATTNDHANDTTLFKYNATVSGATPGIGMPLGEGVDLNDPGNYLLVSDLTNWGKSTNFTMCIWMNFTSVSGSETLIRKGSQGGADNTLLLYFSGSANQMALYDGSTQSHISYNPSAGTYAQVCAILNESSRAEIYIDGEKKPLTQNNLLTFTDDSDPLNIGGWSGVGLDADVDQVAFWDRVLTPLEIRSINRSPASELVLINIKPEIISYNLTSEGGLGCTNWDTDKENACVTSDTTPTVKIKTDINAYCAIGLTDSNYTDMDRSSSCSGGGSLSHTCTLDATDELTQENSYIYIGCKSPSGDENLTSTSGALKVQTFSLEDGGRSAIESGIDSALSSDYTIYTDQKTYARDSANNQFVGLFDKVVKWMNKIWAFNYITGDDVHVGGFNVSPVFYVLEIHNSTAAETDTIVYDLVMNTK